jgi:hypothetical protein
VVGEVGVGVDLVVVGELRELGLVDGVWGRGRGRGREGAERGDGVGHGGEDACDDEGRSRKKAGPCVTCHVTDIRHQGLNVRFGT